MPLNLGKMNAIHHNIGRLNDEAQRLALLTAPGLNRRLELIEWNKEVCNCLAEIARLTEKETYPPDQFIVATGNPFEYGIRVYGDFPTREAAQAFVDRNPRRFHDSWWILELINER